MISFHIFGVIPNLVTLCFGKGKTFYFSDCLCEFPVISTSLDLSTRKVENYSMKDTVKMIEYNF